MTLELDRPPTRRELGQRVRSWRLRRELSQQHVARIAGVTQAALSNYENGKRDMRLTTLLGVSAALNVSVGELLDVPEVIVLRDSPLGHAVQRWQSDGAAGVE